MRRFAYFPGFRTQGRLVTRVRYLAAGLCGCVSNDLQMLGRRLLADRRRPTLDQGKQLMAQLVWGHRAVDERREEGGTPDG
jgi:hypothetical protein